MIFWIVMPLLTIVAVAFVIVPLLRSRKAAGRMTAPDLSPATTQGKLGSAWLIMGLAALVTVPAIALYVTVGRPSLPGVESRVDGASQADGQGSGTPASTMAGMIAKLEDRVQRDPKDAEGWQTLGWAFMHIRQPGKAAQAYRHAVALAPEKTEYRSALAEATIQNGSGKISQVVVADLRRVVAADPADARARFYLALYKDQQGDHRGAIDDWITLIKSGPTDAPWIPEVRSVVEQVAKEQHLDVSAKLPAAPVVAATTPPIGPTGEQMAAAQNMTVTDRNAMIHSMVDRLAMRLKQDPHDAEGWLRLMRAYSVLGEQDKAKAAYRDARNAFAKEPAELANFENQARLLGVAGG